MNMGCAAIEIQLYRMKAIRHAIMPETGSKNNEENVCVAAYGADAW